MEETGRRILIRAAMKAPYLAKDEEQELALRWKESRDQQALHRITVAHMRLVIAMAGKFRYFGLPMGDLYWRVTAVSATGLDGFPAEARPVSIRSYWRRPEARRPASP